MIHDYTSNINSVTSSKGYNPVDSLYPALNTSYVRMTKLFINKCSEQINSYSSCLDNHDWKNDINQFITKEKRLECWSQLSSLKSCSNKNLGKLFSLKMESNRQIELLESEEDKTQRIIEQYNNMITNKLQFIKQDLPGSSEGSDGSDE
jgi:hypothetical protein